MLIQKLSQSASKKFLNQTFETIEQYDLIKANNFVSPKLSHSNANIPNNKHHNESFWSVLGIIRHGNVMEFELQNNQTRHK